MKNVVFILTDQQRKDSLSCYGAKTTRTPNCQRLAEMSMVFNRAYVANPICMPNRLSIFTGMYPRNHGMWTNGLLLEHERRTLATELLDHGYQTASFGKIHFEPYNSPADSGSRESVNHWEAEKGQVTLPDTYWGFSEVALTLSHRGTRGHYGEWFYCNGGTDLMRECNEDGTSNIPPSLHESTFIGEKSVQFIREDRDKSKPFFMVASFPDPHHPFDPPKACVEGYSDDDASDSIGGPQDLETRPVHYKEHYRGGWHRSGRQEEAHPNGISDGEEKRRKINTYGMVNLIDENVGKILDALEEEGLMDDTVIVYTSDHGELLGDHGLWTKGPFFYEGLINIAMMIYDPDMEKGYSEALTSSVDIVPTVCELLGINIPLYVNGVSQKRHLEDPNIHVRERCLVEYRNGYGDNDCASMVLITDRYKYARYQDGVSELTDLKKDPREIRNVVDDKAYENTVREMSLKLLDEILATQQRHPRQLSLA